MKIKKKSNILCSHKFNHNKYHDAILQIQKIVIKIDHNMLNEIFKCQYEYLHIIILHFRKKIIDPIIMQYNFTNCENYFDYCFIITNLLFDQEKTFLDILTYYKNYKKKFMTYPNGYIVNIDLVSEKPISIKIYTPFSQICNKNLKITKQYYGLENNDYFGQSIDINDNGNIFAMSSSNSKYVMIIMNDIVYTIKNNFNIYFGYKIALNSVGDIIWINSLDGYLFKYGFCKLSKQWHLLSTITHTHSYFALNIEIDFSGNIIVAGNPNYNNNIGMINIYSSDIHQISLLGNEKKKLYGQSITIDELGKRMAIAHFYGIDIFENNILIQEYKYTYFFDNITSSDKTKILFNYDASLLFISISNQIEKLEKIGNNYIPCKIKLFGNTLSIDRLSSNYLLIGNAYNDSINKVNNGSITLYKWKDEIKKYEIILQNYGMETNDFLGNCVKMNTFGNYILYTCSGFDIDKIYKVNRGKCTYEHLF